MNVLILGVGPVELAWANWVREQSEHRLDAVLPGFNDPSLAGIPVARDLDDALARPGIDVAIVGGPIDVRGEYLRRAAAEGLAIICLHPPGLDSEAYYLVALSSAETGAVIVPDLPLRLSPGVAEIRRALATGELGAYRGLRIEVRSDDASADLARLVFPRAVDLVRAILGEIEALTATGDPAGEHPNLELIVQLRAAGAQRAEVRIESRPDAPARLMLLCAEGTLVLEFDTHLGQSARLMRRLVDQGENEIDLVPWQPRDATFAVLLESIARRQAAELPHPNLLDGTRAMELAEATVRSLRRGRTVDLHYEAISEESSFKSVMTSTGCVIFLAGLMAIPVALAGPPLGLGWTIYIAYFVPVGFGLFVVLQLLRLVVKRPKNARDPKRNESQLKVKSQHGEPNEA
jgi:predicted dehydrogenase